VDCRVKLGNDDGEVGACGAIASRHRGERAEQASALPRDVAPRRLAVRGDAVTIARMAVAALRWFKAALLLQIVLLAYWLAIELVDLHPWNDIGARPANYDLNRSLAANALQQLAYMGVFALGLRLLSFAPALGYAVYLALQIWTWWVPYAAGASAAWQERYGELYAATVQLLPSSGAHLPPDAQHLVLQGLTVLVIAVTAKAATLVRHL
jgi:hypothetical protein